MKKFSEALILIIMLLLPSLFFRSFIIEGTILLTVS